MLLGTHKLTDGTKIYDVNTNICKLLVRGQFKAPKQSTLGSTSLRQARHMAHIIFNLMLDHKITVTRFAPDAQGTKTLIPNVRLGDIAEISAQNEGVVFVRQLDENDPDDDDYIVEFSIDLNNSGSIACNKDSYLRVELDGMKKFNSTIVGYTDQDATFTFFSMGSFKRINEHIKYSYVAAKAGVKTAFQCDAHYSIAVDYNLDKLNLQSVAGEYLEMRGDEMSIIANDVSETVLNFGGICLPYFKFRTLPIALFQSGELANSYDGCFYLLSNKNYETTAPAGLPPSAAVAQAVSVK